MMQQGITFLTIFCGDLTMFFWYGLNLALYDFYRPSYKFRSFLFVFMKTILWAFLIFLRILEARKIKFFSFFVLIEEKFKALHSFYFEKTRCFLIFQLKKTIKKW